MEVHTEATSRGERVLVNGKAQFSSYGPEKEALAWIAGLELSSTATLFLAGDSQGYLEAAVAATSGCRVVHLLPAVGRIPPEKRSSPWYWAPELGPLSSFVERTLELTGPEDCLWQVWPAFERAAPETSLDWARTFRDVYRQVQGSWLTNSHSGATWWSNSLRNLVHWETPCQPRPGQKPILVAASGPSLEAGWEVLARHRADFELWALPSSIHALRLRGLEPDVVVATDGGFYAREHLQRLEGSPSRVLAALSGAADPVLEHRPTLFFSQGLPWEEDLLSGFPFPPTRVPSQGTVAVSALQWALALTSGPVLVAGLDLAFRDFRAHASGHTVERRLSSVVNRLTPWESVWGERALEQAPLVLGPGVRTSPAMRTYALWLGQAPRFSRPPQRLCPSAVTWPGMDEQPWSALPGLVQGGRQARGVEWLEVNDWPNKGQRTARVRKLMHGWKALLSSRQMPLAQQRHWAETACPTELQEHLRDAKRPKQSLQTDLSGPLRAFLDTLEDW